MNFAYPSQPSQSALIEQHVRVVESRLEEAVPIECPVLRGVVYVPCYGKAGLYAVPGGGTISGAFLWAAGAKPKTEFLWPRTFAKAG